MSDAEQTTLDQVRASATRLMRHGVRGAWLVAVAVVLVGCSDGGEDTAVERAKAEVSAKQEALADAQSAAADAADEFCGAGNTYVLALDRYGDVLTSSAPTVGDVTDAGDDLDAPREDAADAAEDAVKARDDVTAAEQELADARAALAELQTGKKGTGTGETASESPSKLPPMPPAETVNRIERAESELESARAGIDDRTSLEQASQQFNAAAVALEMSWLRLYAEAGCLTGDEEERAEAAVADYTSTLQSSLSEAGYYQGPVDGIYGPETVDAVEGVQEAHGLPVTGTVDKATAAALESDLQEKGGAAAEEAIASTAAVQQTLKLAGFWDGPVDGEWTPELTDALSSFQAELGVEPTGTVDAATLAALEQAIEAGLQAEPTPSPDSTPTSTTATSTSPAAS